MPDPLVVSVRLDAATQQRFDAERARLFPRSPVGAHVTLFHALPGDRRDDVLAAVRTAAARPAFDVRVSGVLPLGRGAAYRVESAELDEVHGVIRAGCEPWLTRQDAQPFRAHLTVQNKVDASTARATVERLRTAFVPIDAYAEGLTVWRYVGGPWERDTDAPFRS